MKTTVRFVRSTDDVIEVRVAMHNRVIVSRINYTHLARVRQTLAAIERIRTDAIRIGLFELALSPTSVSRDFLSKAAVETVDRVATDADTWSSGILKFSAAELSHTQFA